MNANNAPITESMFNTYVRQHQSYMERLTQVVNKQTSLFDRMISVKSWIKEHSVEFLQLKKNVNEMSIEVSKDNQDYIELQSILVDRRIKDTARYNHVQYENMVSIANLKMAIMEGTEYYNWCLDMLNNYDTYKNASFERMLEKYPKIRGYLDNNSRGRMIDRTSTLNDKNKLETCISIYKSQIEQNTELLKEKQTNYVNNVILFDEKQEVWKKSFGLYDKWMIEKKTLEVLFEKTKTETIYIQFLKKLKEYKELYRRYKKYVHTHSVDISTYYGRIEDYNHYLKMYHNQQTETLTI